MMHKIIVKTIFNFFFISIVIFKKNYEYLSFSHLILKK